MKKLIVLAAALCMVATSAYAAEWNFYGSSRVNTMYKKVENQSGSTDNTNLSEWLQTNARIGANVKASDSLTGRFEYGTASLAGAGNANIRLLFGEWNFGGGKLLVGQDYSPLTNMTSNSVYAMSTTSDELDMLFCGFTYSGRNPQIKLTFGDFQIAAVAPDTNLDAASGVPLSTQVMLPQFEASYRLAMNNWWVKLGAGYQTFDVYNAANQTGNDNSVDAYIGALTAGVTFGPVTFSGDVFAGQNAGNLITIGVSDLAFGTGGRAKYTLATNTVVDNDVFGYALVATYKATDMFTFEAGLGVAETEFDEAGAPEDEVIQYYIQSVVTLAPGVSITPEIGVVDFKDAGQSENTYLAVKWQLNF